MCSLRPKEWSVAEFKGSKTEQNLMKSYAGESQARNRYTLAAKVAEKEGYPQIAQLFLETADNERVHANTMFKHFQGGMVEITASYPAGVSGTTIDHLLAAAEGEFEEHSDLYPAFAQTAEQEGFGEIATMYRLIGGVEKWHERRFRELADNIKNEMVFAKAETRRWVCRKCGHVHEGAGAPKVCAACKHPQKYFEIRAENW
jgi:rubrerythrin